MKPIYDSHSMAGLKKFIVDIRKCRTREEEEKTIFKELGKIRGKFSGHHILKGYDKKKYLCKLIFMFFLGHKSDLGQMEAVNLLTSNAYSEKKIGYLFISVVMDEENKFTPLIINSLRDDLSSTNKNFQNLALQFISNNASPDVSQKMIEPVLDVLVSNTLPPFLRQTAALTFLRLLQLTPSLVTKGQFWDPVVLLLSHHDLGLVTAVASLVDWMTSQLPANQCLSCVPPVIIKLKRIVDIPPREAGDYNYYGVPAPWLMVKLLRILRKFPAPSNAALLLRYRQSLESILKNVQALTRHQRGLGALNATYAVIFEAIANVVETDIDPSLLLRSVEVLTDAYQSSEPNFRMTSLELMTRLSYRPELKRSIRTRWDLIVETLHSEIDTSLRKRSLDLLYAVCDEENVKDIASEMVSFVKDDQKSSSARRDVISKLSGLVRRFQDDLTWNVDTVFETLLFGGDDVDDVIWYSMAKLVAANPAVHAHAAKTAFRYLSMQPCPEVLVKAAGYILGEFGKAIDRLPSSSPVAQIEVLQAVYPKCSSSTRALLLTAFMKFIRVYPGQKSTIQSIFREVRNIQSEDVEIQQRAVEYLTLTELGIPLGIPPTPTLDNLSLKVKVPDNEKVSESPQGTKITGVTLFQQEDSFLSKGHQNSGAATSIEADALPDDKAEHKIGGFGVQTSNYSDLEKVFGTQASNQQPVSRTPTQCKDDLLVDVSEDSSPAPPKSPNAVKYASKPLKPNSGASAAPLNPNLVYQSSGILHEDPVFRVLVRKESDRHLGTLFLMYTNKSDSRIEDFSVRGNFAELSDSCRARLRAESLDIAPGCCVMQEVEVECLREFSAKPTLHVRFQLEGAPREVNLLLPLTMRMFTKPCLIHPSAFSARWNHLGGTKFGTTSGFPAKFPMLCEIAKSKLRGLGMAIVENVFDGDQSSADVVCSAGNFHSKSGVEGFLVVLHCFLEQKRYELAVRSARKSLASCISNLLYELL